MPLRNRGTQRWGWEWGFGGCSLRGQAIRRCPVYRKFKNSRTDWEVVHFYYHRNCTILNNIGTSTLSFPSPTFPLCYAAAQKAITKRCFQNFWTTEMWLECVVSTKVSVFKEITFIWNVYLKGKKRLLYFIVTLCILIWILACELISSHMCIHLNPGPHSFLDVQGLSSTGHIIGPQ